MREIDILEHTLRPEDRALLRDFARRLRAHYGETLERVVIFGSRARGDVTDESDIDLLVVLRVPISQETAEDRAVWGHLEASKTELGVHAPVSLIVFAEDRFAELRRRERRFALDVEAEGIPV